MYQCRYLLDFFGLNLRKAADGLRDLNAYHSVWDFCHRKKFGSERNTLDRLNSIKKNLIKRLIHSIVFKRIFTFLLDIVF